MRRIAMIAAAAACMSVFAVTATKEWVQNATNDVLDQAKAYADALPSGVGEMDVRSIVCDFASTNSVLSGGPYVSVNGDTMFYGNIMLDDVGLLTASSGGSVLVGDAGVLYLQNGANLTIEDGVSVVDNMADGFCRMSFSRGVSNRVESLAGVVGAWQSYWDGDDVRVTITNYYGSLDIPSLYIEQKMPPNETHATPWFKTIWDERTRWNSFLDGYNAITNDVAENKADRAWGVYDSSSGAYSPDGLLQLSQEQIMIASGMSYQKTVTSGGCAVWVLSATDPTRVSGVSSNGFFRIEDGDGNALFEIVKGDKRTVGAVATGVSVSDGAMTVSYNSVSDEHPMMEVCTDLSAADWQNEDSCTVATVSWSGSSGAWIATVTPVGARTALFAKATFEAGGNTYIRNNVATSIDKVVVGGHEYTVSVETVNGKKLLVLR